MLLLLFMLSIIFRCIPRVNQVPVLLQLPYSASSPLEKRYKIEGYVESIFEGRRPPGQTLSSLFTTQGKAYFFESSVLYSSIFPSKCIDDRLLVRCIHCRHHHQQHADVIITLPIIIIIITLIITWHCCGGSRWACFR